MIAAHQLDGHVERHTAVAAAGREAGDVLLEALARRSEHWLAVARAAESDPFAIFGPPDPHLKPDLATIATAFAIASAAGFQLRCGNGLEMLDSLESSLELARVLREEPNLDVLSKLSLTQGITQDALDVLLASDRLASLRELSLDGPIAGATAQIAKARWTQQITGLTVAGRFLRPDGARAIASSFPRLRRLVAQGIEAECLAIALTAPFIANLETAQFGGNAFTGVVSPLDDDDAVKIASAPWNALHFLQLSGPHIGERGARALLDSKTLAPGIKLSLLDVELSDELRAALKARFDVLLKSRGEAEDDASPVE